MNEEIKKLKALNSLQNLQNGQLLENRVSELEESLLLLESAVAEIQNSLASLRMEFNKDHTALGAVERREN